MKKIEKMKVFLKTKKGKQVGIIGLIIIFALILYLPFSFASVQPVKSIIIQSEKTNYEKNEVGSWQVEKSGKWIKKGTAQVTFDVDTNEKLNSKYTDIIFVLDISGSMNGSKLDRVKSDTTELIESLLSNKDNRAALITFDTDSEILSNFTNDKDTLINQVNNLQTKGNTNYYQALVNVDNILKDYQKEPGREMIVLFLTDGYPCEDTPNEVPQYQLLKEKYPYITINGIQYEMGDSVLDTIKKISDNQFIADMDTLNNVLFDASIVPITYEKYEIVDYIDNRYFTLKSEDDIEVSQGKVKLEEEDGKQKITWTITDLKSGNGAKLTMNLKLKDEYIGQGGVYPTNEKEEVITKLEDQEEDVKSNDTPILADNYKVIYDGNAPEGCSVKNVPSTNQHSVFDTVEISSETPSCEGYQFKGWKVVTKEAEKVNDDYFIMPEEDVIVRATWSKLKLAKSMDGTISKAHTLYAIMQEQAVMDNEKSEFVSSSSGIDFDKSSSNTNGKGIYTRAGTENDEYPIYYYRGAVDNNHVKFAGFCWKAVRTTETGGVKLIYDGVPDSNGYCKNTGTASQIGTSTFNSNYDSPADVGYMYGTRYTYSKKSMGTSYWYNFVNKSRISRSITSGTNYYYGDSVTYNNGTYTLTNPKQYTWSSNYYHREVEGKYTCLSETDTSCSTVAYVDSTGPFLYYVNMTNGETYGSLIGQANQLKWVYGNDVIWDGSKYTLVDTIESSPMDWSSARTNLAKKYHYTCLGTENTCSNVYYIYYFGDSSTVYYFPLKNGVNIENAKDEMFTNTTDSKIKTTIDTWYATNMTEYTKYLEDTIWCNDRSFYSGSLKGKDTDVGTEPTSYSYFGAYGRRYSTYKPTTSCPNNNDAFTVSSENGNGKLTYPVALLTVDEATLAGNVGAYLNTGQLWWLLSPAYFSHMYGVGVRVFLVKSAGLSYVISHNRNGVRPSVSLANGGLVVDGDGSSEHPYVIDTSDV